MNWLYDKSKQMFLPVFPSGANRLTGILSPDHDRCYTSLAVMLRFTHSFHSF
ncbi:MAG TPA: hypothetical protein VGC76_06430 [Pyrinomonadaceae bacterium]